MGRAGGSVAKCSPSTHGLGSKPNTVKKKEGWRNERCALATARLSHALPSLKNRDLSSFSMWSLPVFRLGPKPSPWAQRSPRFQEHAQDSSSCLPAWEARPRSAAIRVAPLSSGPAENNGIVLSSTQDKQLRTPGSGDAASSSSPRL